MRNAGKCRTADFRFVLEAGIKRNERPDMTAVASSASIQNSEVAFSRGRLADWVARAVAILRNLGPYAAIELILPGGTLMALLLWLYRSHKKAEARV